MSKSKCTGACCKHVAAKLVQNVPMGAYLPDSGYEFLTKRVVESKKLADLHRELGIIHGQYAGDVEQLLFEVSMVSMRNGLAPYDELGQAKLNGKLKSVIRSKAPRYGSGA